MRVLTDRPNGLLIFLAALAIFHSAYAPLVAGPRQDDISGNAEAQVERVELDTDLSSGSYDALYEGLFASSEQGGIRTRPIDPTPREVLKLGPVRVIPKWDQEIYYDDNVFLTKNDQQSDVILVTRPGIVADYTFAGGTSRFIAGYEMERNHFLRDNASDFTEHLATLRFEIKRNHLSFELADRFEDRTDPILAVFTGKIERRLNTVSNRIGWNDDSWYVEFRAQRVVNEYDEVGFSAFDRDEDRLTVEHGRRLTESLWALAQGGYVGRTFELEELNDARGFLGNVGLRLVRDSDWETELRLGFRLEHYADDVPTDSRDRSLTPDLSLRGKWQVGPRSAVEFDYLHISEFSPISNFQELDRGELIYAFALGSKLTARLGGQYERVDPSEGRSFNRTSTGVGLRYGLRANIHLSFDYLGRFRRSAASDGDYDGNTVALGLLARF